MKMILSVGTLKLTSQEWKYKAGKREILGLKDIFKNPGYSYYHKKKIKSLKIKH